MRKHALVTIVLVLAALSIGVITASSMPTSPRLHRLHSPPALGPVETATSVIESALPVASAPTASARPAPPPIPPGAVVGVPFICTGPVSDVVVQGTGSSTTALVMLNKGCTGTIRLNVTITSGGGDGVKVNAGAHDLTIGPSSITCSPGVPRSQHQDGVQIQGGTNVTFVGLAVQCSSVNQGAAAFYIDGKDFSGISNVVCDGCNLEHSHYAVMFTGPAPGSGVRNSILHKGIGYSRLGDLGGNVFAPACSAVIPC